MEPVEETLFPRKLLLIFGLSVAIGFSASHAVDLWDANVQPPTTIVLIGLESTRADHLGPCYGYERQTAPDICQVAEDGVLFENAYAQGSWTPVSIPTMLSGRTPREVGIKWGRNQRFSRNLTMFPEVIVRHGYRARTTALDTFEFEEANILQGFEYGTSFNWNRTGPHLLFAYFTDPHVPYTPEDQFRRWDNLSMSTDRIRTRIRWNDHADRWRPFVNATPVQTLIDLYDGEIRSMDHEVGTLISRLESRGMYEDALIVVFADHGEGFGEHDRLADHGGRPYQEVTHVPLIMKLPGNDHAGLRVDETVRLVDIPHTVLDVTGIDTRFGTVGASLLPLIDAHGSVLGALRKDGGDRVVFSAESWFGDWLVQKGDYTYFLRNPRRTCVRGFQPRSEQLYDLATDPEQRDNIANIKPKIVHHLRAELCDIYTFKRRNASYFQNSTGTLTDDELTERGPQYWPYIQ